MTTVKSVRQLSTTEPLFDIGVKKNHNFFANDILVHNCQRFNKAQQDVLLPGIEDGTVILFGATTEKPKFAVNSTILSRTMIWEVKSLSDSEMVMVLKRVLKFYKLNNKNLTIQPDAAKLLINRSSGDCRKLITAMETIIEVLLDGSAEIVIEHIDAVIPEKHIVFDKTGNEHYDLASAMQSSVQNSDADAAIYWLAKWLESGEDPSYIARRILIMAFEDAGDSQLAILSATAATFAAERIGYPECMIPMAHAVIAAAQSGRAKIAYKAIKAAVNDVRSKATVYVPSELRAGAHGEYISPINRRYVLGDLVANGRLDFE